MDNSHISQKRIRESAPFRKSMSLSIEDMGRAAELEKAFTAMFPNECPFTFSKTISTAMEIALQQISVPIVTQTPNQQPRSLPASPHVPSHVSPDKSKNKRMFGQSAKR